MPRNPIMVIAGTNRPASNALRIARAIETLYRELDVPVSLLSLADLPREIFDGAAYATKPPGMVELQNRVLAASGLHLVVPEYNGSFPGVLKYFIDMLKFPESFERKPVAFVGEANGVFGGLRAVEQLQLVFGYRNAYTYPPRVFIPNVRAVFDESGKIVDASLARRLREQVAGFFSFIGCIVPAAVPPTFDRQNG